MLLIRPLLETNAERKHVAHTVVFFIFVVCNCGGLLLPIGDPPLFLGYLNGVDFLWTLSLWRSWLFVNGALLAVYLSGRSFLSTTRTRRSPTSSRRDAGSPADGFPGCGPTALLLVGVILSVALLDPGKPLPGTDWHPWMYLREMVQLALVARVAAARAAGRARRQQLRLPGDRRGGGAVRRHLRRHAAGAGDSQRPRARPWASTRRRSSSGPRACCRRCSTTRRPTWCSSRPRRRCRPATGRAVAGVAEPLLAAISLGAVLMGAMTYIGNGPNFMVKTIAEKSGVRMPSFFGYMVYSVVDPAADPGARRVAVSDRGRIERRLPAAAGVVQSEPAA